jgi:hypothetical protein
MRNVFVPSVAKVVFTPARSMEVVNDPYYADNNQKSRNNVADNMGPNSDYYSRCDSDYRGNKSEGRHPAPPFLPSIYMISDLGIVKTK